MTLMGFDKFEINLVSGYFHFEVLFIFGEISIFRVANSLGNVPIYGVFFIFRVIFIFGNVLIFGVF